MDFLRANQLDIMMYMSGVCGVLAILSLMPKFMSRRRRSILALMEICSMLLLNFDRLAYVYRGDTSDFGGLMVRLTNGKSCSAAIGLRSSPLKQKPMPLSTGSN